MRKARWARSCFPLPSPVFQNAKRTAALWVDPFRFPLTEDRSTNRVERARDAHRVGVKVAHRRFQRFMPHDLLNGPGVGPAVETMGGIGVARFVREDGQMGLLAGFANGALEIGLVQSPTHPFAAARINARLMGRKKPGPLPIELRLRVFCRQLMGQRDRSLAQTVPVPNNPC